MRKAFSTPSFTTGRSRTPERRFSVSSLVSNAVLNVTHAAFESQDTLDIFGTTGSLHVPVLNAGSLTVRTADGERIEEHPPHANIHLPLVDDFTRAVLEGREPAVDAEIGREVARIEDEIYGDSVPGV